MRQPEPLPPFLRRLFTLSTRALIGALLGSACTVAILAGVIYIWGDRFEQKVMPTWSAILAARQSIGILLGAVYYPLATATLLERENLPLATIAVMIAAIAGGMVAAALGGPSAIVVGASIGFWSLCATLYRNHRRSDAGAGFQSYFR